MGEEIIIINKEMRACSHGGIYSVNPRLVRLDYSSSINPLGTPRKAIAAIKMNANSIACNYPDPECRQLKRSLSRYLGIDEEWISVGNGAIEVIYWFVQATLAKGRVVIPAPTFCEYELASQKAGAEVTFVPLHDLELNAHEVIEKARGADAIFLCNPNNPTGILATPQIMKIIENVDSSTRILLDECFIELADNPNTNMMIERLSKFDNLVILRSLTKSFGLAGLRVGYSVCNPTLAKKLSANRIPWNVNGIAQVAGVAALLERSSYLSKARALIKRERKFLHDGINKLKSFRPIRSDSNYFLVQLQGRNSTQFRDRLLKKTGVLVRDCSTFTGMGTQYIRLAVKMHRENTLLLKALETFDYND
ncbi:MAG: histidinol-phosphate aminotransferase family protein [Thermoproteota archaeon]|nr:histidinol-phosphate aminotransferase family protein [Thermoproteota archaeon]